MQIIANLKEDICAGWCFVPGKPRGRTGHGSTRGGGTLPSRLCREHSCRHEYLPPASACPDLVHRLPSSGSGGACQAYGAPADPAGESVPIPTTRRCQVLKFLVFVLVPTPGCFQVALTILWILCEYLSQDFPDTGSVPYSNLNFYVMPKFLTEDVSS